MSRSNDDWDELTERTSQRRKSRKKRNKRAMSLDEQADADFDERHASKFVEDLAGKNSSFNWMKDERNKRMFNQIENRIQGAIGGGSYDWVDRRVFDQVFDRLTLMSLYKMMNSGILDTLDFPIARGKEAHVFHGTDHDGNSVAVKIFHTSNAVFKNLMQYIEGDPRFGGLRRRHRDLVDIWVRKEHRNLTRLHRWGLPVPRPIAVQKNVLVMEYLGFENEKKINISNNHWCNHLLHSWCHFGSDHPNISQYLVPDFKKTFFSFRNFIKYNAVIGTNSKSASYLIIERIPNKKNDI